VGKITENWSLQYIYFFVAGHMFETGFKNMLLFIVECASGIKYSKMEGKIGLWCQLSCG
jgi:hypothetical protein